MLLYSSTTSLYCYCHRLHLSTWYAHQHRFVLLPWCICPINHIGGKKSSKWKIHWIWSFHLSFCRYLLQNSLYLHMNWVNVSIQYPINYSPHTIHYNPGTYFIAGSLYVFTTFIISYLSLWAPFPKPSPPLIDQFSSGMRPYSSLVTDLSELFLVRKILFSLPS